MEHEQNAQDTFNIKLMNDYLSMDENSDYQVSKNEWLFSLLRILEKDMDKLEKEGTDSVLKYIEGFCEEFDKYDTDKNGYLSYEEYKRAMQSTIALFEI